MKKFTGTIHQTPPIYSAIKVKGKRLYEFARKGQIVDLKKRKVKVSEFNITSVNLPHVDFKIKCSKGTYIRSIANDFGQELEVGAYLHKLTRSSIGKFKLENAITINDFEKIIKKLI